MTWLIEVNRAGPSVEALYSAARRFRHCPSVCLVHTIASGRPAEVAIGERVLREAAQNLRRLHRGLSVDARLMIGAAADQVLRLAEELQPALIVMGAYGEGDFPRMSIIGRVAGALLESGRHPVLLVSPSESRLCRPHRSAAARPLTPSARRGVAPPPRAPTLQLPAAPL